MGNDVGLRLRQIDRRHRKRWRDIEAIGRVACDRERWVGTRVGGGAWSHAEWRRRR